MNITLLKQELIQGVSIPYLGIGIFSGLKPQPERPIPHDSDSMILALNNGRAMAPRLMLEYPRAAMQIEQHRGREYLTQSLAHLYSQPFEPTEVHRILKDLGVPYIIDTNRDTKLHECLKDETHLLIKGESRILGDKERYTLYEYDTTQQSYYSVEEELISDATRILFKPMGSPLPTPSFIASDADYVDWLTEAMGGFALPNTLKTYRKGKKYLFLGVSFQRDTERMVANELTLDCEGGYFITPETPNKKAQRFLDQHDFTHIPLSLEAFLTALKGA